MEKENKYPETEALQQVYRTSYLVAGFIRGILTEEEREELDLWILEDKANMHLFGVLTKQGNIEKSLADFAKIETEIGLEEVKRRGNFRRKTKSSSRWKYAVAATLIILAGLAFLIIKISQRTLAEKDKRSFVMDITPATDKATLTLENGKTIILGSGTDTVINPQISVSGKQGEIVYTKGLAEQETKYHTLTIPRKGHYKLVLSDGTRVWLNAASSIRFPLAFTGEERKVYVTGETFFEVAADKAKPFRAVAGELVVEAVGTAFNINAYSNEPAITTTLTEGIIKVSAGEINTTLSPGEQLQWQGNELKRTTVLTDDVVAWKNNEFIFHDTSLDVIMRQVERWYDAKVVFNDRIDIHLNATIARNVPISKLLQLLQETGQVKFKIEGNNISVSK